MPCRSDHMEPTAQERHRKTAANLLLYVYNKTDRIVEQWMTRRAADYYGGKDDACIVKLCEVLTDMETSERDDLLYNNRDRVARRLADWWEDHLKVDSDRRQQELATKRAKVLRKIGLAKLTDAEKDALGLLK